MNRMIGEHMAFIFLELPHGSHSPTKLSLSLNRELHPEHSIIILKGIK